MRGILFRTAVENDREQLEQLFYEGFGIMAKRNGALSWIEGRYTVAELQNDSAVPDNSSGKIIAVSGILGLEQSDYNGYGITWTCTKKEYRKQGLIVEILRQCGEKLPDDNIPLYCKCWKIADNEYINLGSVMKRLNMNKLMPI